MTGSESDCESLDSGLETGNSNLEPSETGFISRHDDHDNVTDEEETINSAESNLSDYR